jgi:hypothetical protein
VNYPEWAAAVKEELGKPAPINLQVSAVINNSIIYIHVDALGTEGLTNGMLQVWILEDGIKAMQMMPDGSSNPDYIHHHVFRKAVNGTWGEEATIKEGEEYSWEFSQAADPEWNTSKLSVVTFVFNDNGVQQVSKTKIIN